MLQKEKERNTKLQQENCKMVTFLGLLQCFQPEDVKIYWKTHFFLIKGSLLKDKSNLYYMHFSPIQVCKIFHQYTTILVSSHCRAEI